MLLIRVRISSSSNSSNSSSNSNGIVFSVRISSSINALVMIALIVAFGRTQPSAISLGELDPWASILIKARMCVCLFVCVCQFLFLVCFCALFFSKFITL